MPTYGACLCQNAFGLEDPEHLGERGGEKRFLRPYRGAKVKGTVMGEAGHGWEKNVPEGREGNRPGERGATWTGDEGFSREDLAP